MNVKYKYEKYKNKYLSIKQKLSGGSFTTLDLKTKKFINSFLQFFFNVLLQFNILIIKDNILITNRFAQKAYLKLHPLVECSKNITVEQYDAIEFKLKKPVGCPDLSDDTSLDDISIQLHTFDILHDIAERLNHYFKNSGTSLNKYHMLKFKLCILLLFKLHNNQTMMQLLNKSNEFEILKNNIFSNSYDLFIAETDGISLQWGPELNGSMASKIEIPLMKIIGLIDNIDHNNIYNYRKRLSIEPWDKVTFHLPSDQIKSDVYTDYLNNPLKTTPLIQLPGGQSLHVGQPLPYGPQSCVVNPNIDNYQFNCTNIIKFLNSCTARSNPVICTDMNIPDDTTLQLITNTIDATISLTKTNTVTNSIFTNYIRRIDVNNALKIYTSPNEFFRQINIFLEYYYYGIILNTSINYLQNTERQWTHSVINNLDAAFSHHSSNIQTLDYINIIDKLENLSQQLFTKDTITVYRVQNLNIYLNDIDNGSMFSLNEGKHLFFPIFLSTTFNLNSIIGDNNHFLKENSFIFEIELPTNSYKNWIPLFDYSHIPYEMEVFINRNSVFKIMQLTHCDIRGRTYPKVILKLLSERQNLNTYDYQAFQQWGICQNPPTWDQPVFYQSFPTNILVGGKPSLRTIQSQELFQKLSLKVIQDEKLVKTSTNNYYKNYKELNIHLVKNVKMQLLNSRCKNILELFNYNFSHFYNKKEDCTLEKKIHNEYEIENEKCDILDIDNDNVTESAILIYQNLLYNLFDNDNFITIFSDMFKN